MPRPRFATACATIQATRLFVLIMRVTPEQAGEERRRPVGRAVFEHEKHRHAEEEKAGCTRRAAPLEVFLDEVAHQKSAPEKLFQDRNDQRKTHESSHDREPVQCRIGDEVGIESIHACGLAEEQLRTHPHRQDDKACADAPENPAPILEFVLLPENRDDDRADNRLKREDPIPRLAKQQGVGALAETLDKGHEAKACEKDQERQSIAARTGREKRIAGHPRGEPGRRASGTRYHFRQIPKIGAHHFFVLRRAGMC